MTKVWFVILYTGAIGASMQVDSDITRTNMVRCQQIMRQAYNDRLNLMLKDPALAVTTGELDFACVESNAKPKRGDVLK